MSEYLILYETKTENYFVGLKNETTVMPISCWRKDNEEHLKRMNQLIEHMKSVRPNSIFEIK